MWPLPKISNESISCIFTPRSLSFSYLILKKDRALLKAYSRIMFSHAELENTVICNFTKIKTMMYNFITQHNYHAQVNIALCGPSIKEKITAKKATIGTAQHASYLYTHDDKSVYYTATINPALLMQYKLMSIAAQINVFTITTPFIAHLKLYQVIHGNAFRHTQLAYDLRTHNHRIETVFTNDMLARMVDISSNVTLDLANERPFLLPSLGLFYLRR